MATILPFQPRDRHEDAAPDAVPGRITDDDDASAANGSQPRGEIVLFTGVRYSRGVAPISPADVEPSLVD